MIRMIGKGICMMVMGIMVRPDVLTRDIVGMDGWLLLRWRTRWQTKRSGKSVRWGTVVGVSRWIVAGAVGDVVVRTGKLPADGTVALGGEMWSRRFS